ncbi:hypothetical protein ASPACDRAFT_127140 [Aspergillus aculeatus ATCC 16872]|uniref:Uncharacterized protein n=1 Tax=Aspergillus aculeatus (strain ATCC 16872 / CBS 172.66 / WB 5094) TaxID=690307 RepID=A0A1L9WGE9_ASPA1|nr:uncharacterized protein ASPACDRAFT_127140 [Aspergillus aculeatus ATCC 16872]OJJ95177.1 hypothetical protein ASPACDRAFT_127140 [Aspergillus aculeatus ATCC 16872]
MSMYLEAEASTRYYMKPRCPYSAPSRRHFSRIISTTKQPKFGSPTSVRTVSMTLAATNTADHSMKTKPLGFRSLRVQK